MRTITSKSTVFFLCDLQEKFRSVIRGFPHILNTANRMIAAAKELGIPLVVTEQNAEKLGPIVPELDVSSAAIRLNKMQFSMITPELSDWLKRMQDRRAAVVFGIEAHVCILQTVADLLDNGYEVTVLADGTSAQHPHDVQLAFELMRQWGAFIVTSESLLFRLMRTAGHEQFRKISALVKDRIPYAHHQ